jgi:hypothetical protein
LPLSMAMCYAHRITPWVTPPDMGPIHNFLSYLQLKWQRLNPYEKFAPG